MTGDQGKPCACGHDRSMHARTLGMNMWCCVACPCMGWKPAPPRTVATNHTTPSASRVRQVGA